MPNPNPKQTKEFLAHVAQPAADLPADVEMAKQPICVKFPVEIDAQLREMEDRSRFIRTATIAALGLDLKDESLSLEAVMEAINRVLVSIPPRDRASAARLFKKFLAQLDNSQQ